MVIWCQIFGQTSFSCRIWLENRRKQLSASFSGSFLCICLFVCPRTRHIITPLCVIEILFCRLFPVFCWFTCVARLACCCNYNMTVMSSQPSNLKFLTKSVRVLIHNESGSVSWLSLCELCTPRFRLILPFFFEDPLKLNCFEWGPSVNCTSSGLSTDLLWDLNGWSAQGYCPEVNPASSWLWVCCRAERLNMTLV